MVVGNTCTNNKRTVRGSAAIKENSAERLTQIEKGLMELNWKGDPVMPNSDEGECLHYLRWLVCDI